MAHAASRPAEGLALLLAAVLMLAWGSVAADDAEDELLFKSAALVNEGELHFLTEPPARPVHHHDNRIIIRDSSLEDGWVELKQCHTHLDPVPDLQITYRAGGIRNLRVALTENVERSWAEASSVQLRNVGRGAKVCIEAESRALTRGEDGSYQLRNGPYMRRFLDGYYPMRVSMRVELATDQVRFSDASPVAQPGFRLWQSGNAVGYEALFEGRLSTVLRFDPVEPCPHLPGPE
ncbi:MAG: hypothetical protein NZ524_09490 [Thiobacillaceae bacterium]|nr:hypothetical protein [Thiobacillaceae bacterium]MCX7673777.1 hypothetical protein [Thiobacillaceae bacterium]MDW8323343.1 hypothetical protein [Burkholderiales bacterium]